MRSIPLAIIWETLRRGRWFLTLGLLVANLLPILIFNGLGRLDLFELDEFTQRVLHSTLIQINMFTFGAAILAAQGPPSRLHALPVTASTIAAWQMIPAMFLVGLEMLLSVGFLNAFYHASWPVWGPTLFVAVTIVAIQATLWFLERTAWLPVGLMFVTGGLGAWYFWRYSAISLRSNRPLIEASAVEVILLLLVAIASYFAGVAGIARNRCGEEIKPLGIVAWIERLFDVTPVFSPPFKSREDAQFWLEWTLKGFGLPVIVIFGVPIAIACWLIGSRNPTDLVNAFINGGGMLSVAGMVMGMVIGNVGPVDSNFQMGHFMATRPVTSSMMAFTILKVAAKSVLSAWLIWLGAFAIVSGILLFSGYMPRPFLPAALRWWYLPATLLGCWTVVGTLTSMLLTGRAKELLQLACGLLAMYIGLVIFANFALPWDARQQLFQGLMITLGIVFVISSVMLFVAARRRHLITTPAVAIAAGAWITFCCVVIVEWSGHRYEPPSSYILVIGLAALTVVPVAAAPLAISWNRNR